MAKNQVLAAFAAAIAACAFSAAALEKSNLGESAGETAKSVAWYVANMQQARAKNKECYADPNAKELQASQDCANSLQALKLSFAGGNQPVSKH